MEQYTLIDSLFQQNTPFLGTFLKAAEIFFQQPSFSAKLCRKSLEKSGCTMQCYLPPLSKIFLPARSKSSAAEEKKICPQQKI
jgi:hypothetical protein